MEKSLLKVQGLSKNLSAYNLHLFRKNGGKNIHTYIHTYADVKEKKGATQSLLWRLILLAYIAVSIARLLPSTYSIISEYVSGTTVA